MNTSYTMMQYLIAATLLFVCLTTNKVQAQSIDRAIESNNRVETMIERMGKDKFIKTARENPAFLESLEARLDGVRGVDMNTKSILREAKNEARLNQKRKRMKMTDHKWLESENWYNSVSEESNSDKVNLLERTYYMYSVDNEGNTSTNRISQWLDGDWHPGSFLTVTTSADELYKAEKSYEDYSTAGWSDQYEYEYVYNEDGNIAMVSSYNAWATEYGDIETEHYRTNYTYDENGYRASITDEYRQGDLWLNEWKREYDYDANGVWLRWADYEWVNNQWLLNRDIMNSYNEDGSWNNQVVEYYDEETGDLYNKIKFELVNDSEGNIIEEFRYVWEFETDSWSDPHKRWLYTYDENGYLLETIIQQYNFDAEVWEYETRLLYTVNYDGFILTYNNSFWDSGTGNWVQYDGYENEYNENNQRTLHTNTSYYEGEVGYSNITEFEYDGDGDVIKRSYSWSDGETTYFDGYEELNYVAEMPEGTPFVSISSLADRPDDQGGYIEISLDGHYVGTTDLHTKYWLVWVRNGDNWENIHRSEYFEGIGSTATVPVYDTKPSDEEPNASNTFDFMITIHGAGGAVLGATNVTTGYAEDNIAPAKVNSLSSSVNDNDNMVNFSWNAVSDSDVDGYHVYMLDGEGGYNSEESLGFTSSTNIQIQRPEEQGDYGYVVVAKDENSNYGEASDPEIVSLTTSNELDEQPAEFDLSQNYPNPFNPTTNIKYALPEAAEVRLSVYDMLGREIAVIVNARKTAGNHTAQFDAGSLSSGTYIYRIEAGNYTHTRKLMLIK